MNITYGFSATMTAKPGLGDQVVELLLTGLEPGNPAANDCCLFYVVSRSASNPDVVHIAEGWTSEEDHHRVFASPEAQAIVARSADLLAGEAEYTDLVPFRGKAVLPDA
jgi:quinol monooxygenase YgiN